MVLTREFLSSILAGLLFWLGFAPFELWAAPILGGIIFFWLLSEKTFRVRLFLSITTGAAFFFPLLHWSSSYVGALPWLILAVGETLIFALICLAPVTRNIHGVFIFASSFTLVELLRMKIPFGGFGWGRIGFTQIDSFSSLYPIFGVTGISFLSLLISAIVLKSSRIKSVVLVLLLLAFLSPSITSKSTGDIRIVAVQGGVDTLGLDFNDRALSVLQRHIDKTPTSSTPDLFIWPENAVDVDPAVNTLARAKLSYLFEQITAPLLVGVVEQTPSGPANSSVLYDERGKIQSRYVKQDLAPFGEYIPLRRIAEKVSPFTDQVRDFVPGKNWVSHTVSGQRFQSFICFEILDDDHVRRGALDTEFLVAQTNNATFGKSSQAGQQLQMTQARAAELNRDFAVVSTTGYTAHISGDGSVMKMADQFVPLALHMTLQTRSGDTLASQLNSLIWALGLILVLGLSLLSTRVYRR